MIKKYSNKTVYTILAEARSGGSALMDWLGEVHPEFTLAQEPWLSGTHTFTESIDVTNVGWIDKHNEIFIREIFYNEKDWQPLLNKSTKVICLYRKNWFAQIRSILFTAREKSEWRFSYTKKEMDDLVPLYDIYDMYLNQYKENKRIFLEWATKNNFPIISYEDLYYGDAINTVKKVFNLNTNKPFPPYKRHLRETNDIENAIGLEPIPDEPTELDLVRIRGNII